MSADSFLAYFGLRFEISPEEIAGAEARSDWRMVAARKVGLTCHWGNFGDAYLLFVGKQIGVLGAEHAEEVRVSSADFLEVSARTRDKLREAGLEGEPALHFRWLPDF